MIVEFEDCTLNTHTRVLWRNGAPVRLQPKVMDLLILLVENHLRYVSKLELLAVLWADVHVGHASLLRAVRVLRQALGDDHRSPRLIRTLHSRGYQWIGRLRVLGEAGTPAFAQPFSN
jgi:DNA-binding winged helix-turn-helix (wHTH) protein